MAGNITSIQKRLDNQAAVIEKEIKHTNKTFGCEKIPNKVINMPDQSQE
jgi:hypothetical protein